MSGSTNPSTKWKIATVFLLLTTILFGAAFGIALSGLTAANNDKASLQSQLDTLKSQISKDNQTIISLNSQITSLNGQISTLEAQNTTNQATIVYLRAQLAANYTALQNLEASSLGILGPFAGQVASNPPICIPILGCFDGNPGQGVVAAIGWANFGTNAAIKVTFTATFYDASGSPLCTTAPINLGTMGMVQGRTINAFTTLTDSCTWPEPLPGGVGVGAASVTGTVTWQDSLTGKTGTTTVTGTIM